MNRLIIIGNGFDLAHKMQTGYYDFILDYLKSCFSEAVAKNGYSDEIIGIERFNFIRVSPIEAVTDVKDFVAFMEEPTLYSFITKGFEVEHAPNKPFSLTVKSNFIKALLTSCCHYNWVDIENEYYSQLKQLVESKEETKEEELKLLNTSMQYLVTRLQMYLKKQKATSANAHFREIFHETIKKGDIVTCTLKRDIIPAQTLVLNFNYTNTVEQYLIAEDESFNVFQTIAVNYIHGEVNNEENPMIFGFGDELDVDYSKIEAVRAKGFLTYMKSFWYFKTSNYHNLIRFLESDIYQVYVMGHSCGLSDRTMLNMIFEHVKCKSIKIFYHQRGYWNNYTELTEEISRHFNNKGEMRKRIVPQDKSFPMPQIRTQEEILLDSL